MASAENSAADVVSNSLRASVGDRYGILVPGCVTDAVVLTPSGEVA
jgi:hypothetical protein